MPVYEMLNEGNFKIICIRSSISKDMSLEVKLMDYGAGIRDISVTDRNGNISHPALSYTAIKDATSNPSLAGLTIGPNAGRLPAEKDICFEDSTSSVTVRLTANENSNQLHGGDNNLSSRRWDIKSIDFDDKNRLSVTFCTLLKDMCEGWPGNRTFFVKYTISDNGELGIDMRATTDTETYINMTNHTYWLRNGSEIKLNVNKMIINRNDFIPIGITNLEQPTEALFSIKKEAVYNNGFLLRNHTHPADMCHAADIIYKAFNTCVSLYTDAPCLIVYTGDYLDNSTLCTDSSLSFPGAAVALEPQELFPFTDTDIASPDHAFHRRILYRFSESI